MTTKQRTYYDREFKQKAMELLYARGNAKEIAEELGIRSELLYVLRIFVPGEGRKFKVTKNLQYNYPVAPNLLDQEFTDSWSGEVWVRELT